MVFFQLPSSSLIFPFFISLRFIDYEKILYTLQVDLAFFKALGESMLKDLELADYFWVSAEYPL